MGQRGTSTSQEFPPRLGLGARPREEGSWGEGAAGLRGVGPEARSAAPRAGARRGGRARAQPAGCSRARARSAPLDPAAPRPLAASFSAPRSRKPSCSSRVSEDPLPSTFDPVPPHSPRPHSGVPKLCANPPPPSRKVWLLFISK